MSLNFRVDPAWPRIPFWFHAGPSAAGFCVQAHLPWRRYSALYIWWLPSRPIQRLAGRLRIEWDAKPLNTLKSPPTAGGQEQPE